jgi:hypothetical protein
MGGFAVIAFLRSLFIDAKPYMTQADARARMAKLMADSSKPRVIYAEPMAETPTPDQAMAAYTDAIYMALLREDEQHSNVIPMRATR